jgi:hypothetical protein
MPLQPLHFYDEPIEALYDVPPTYEKKPECPNGFTWRGETYRVARLLAEWADFARRGRMARNMQPQHARVAANRGSLGVGRFYFRVRTIAGQVFEIYYDRAIKDADHRKGSWVLVGEYADTGAGADAE